MKDKNYIKNDNKIRYCPVNISKMNIFEFCYYNIFHWYIFKDVFLRIYKALKVIVVSLYIIIASILTIVFMPIIAYFTIRQGRKFCEKHKDDGSSLG